MLTTVGASVVAARQENSHQAGASHIYFYDVAATDSHGTGKLQIDTAKHTFEFNGKDFTPSQQIALKARAVGDTDYMAFATGKTTSSGNLHLGGTWEAADAPAEVVGAAASVTYTLKWGIDFAIGYGLWVAGNSYTHDSVTGADTQVHVPGTVYIYYFDDPTPNAWKWDGEWKLLGTTHTVDHPETSAYDFQTIFGGYSPLDYEYKAVMHPDDPAIPQYWAYHS